MFDEATIKRFWSKVDIGDNDECWDWKAGRSSKGYGHFGIASGHNVYAHRVAWVIANGQQIPDGLVIRHACDRPICCNPAHLLLGTRADNSRDMVERDRSSRGEAHGLAKLSESDVCEVRRLHRSGSSTMRGIARQFGVSYPTVNYIINGKTWAWLEDEEE